MLKSDVWILHLYAFLFLLFFRSLAQFYSLADKILNKRFKFWLLSAIGFSITLLIISSTHWANHGLGDTSRIPVSNGKAIYQMNGNQTYITDIQY